MTLDGLLTNIKFDNKTIVEKLNLENTNVIKVSSNFGQKTSEIYDDIIKINEKPKSNTRGRKPIRKITTNRKKQGTGNELNSQTTLTLLSNDIDQSKYSVKLFMNGRIQIPGAKKSVNYDYIYDDIDLIIQFINNNPILFYNKNIGTELKFLYPLLQNYKFRILNPINDNPDFYLDLKKINEAFEQIKLSRSSYFKVYSIKLQYERLAASIIKFSTPSIVTDNLVINKFIELVQLYKKKMKEKKRIKKIISVPPTLSRVELVIWYINQFLIKYKKSRNKYKRVHTTIKIFKSGKINIDYVNNYEYANIIKNIVIETIEKNKESIIYFEPIFNQVIPLE